MNLSLENIAAVAAQAYPDHFLEQEFRRQSKVDNRQSTSHALATYIAGELVDLYDPDSSDEANLARISAGLERSAHLLETLVTELRRLSADSVT